MEKTRQGTRRLSVKVWSSIRFQLLPYPLAMTTEQSEFNSDVASHRQDARHVRCGYRHFHDGPDYSHQPHPRHCGGPDGNDCPVSQPIHPDGSAPTGSEEQIHIGTRQLAAAEHALRDGRKGPNWDL